MAVRADEFQDLMRNLQAGSRDAADRLCRDYQHHIVRVVERRLAKVLRAQVDSHDVVSEVWLSFFARSPADRRFDSPRALIAYLQKMAVNIVAETHRQRIGSGKHCVFRVERDCDLSAITDRPGSVPSPFQQLVAEEEFQRMIRGRPTHERRILTMLRQGMTHSEIAERLKTNVKTVQRLLRRIPMDALNHERHF